VTIQQRFHQFRLNNPHVELRLVEMARQAKQRGHSRLGIELLWSALRWEHLISTNDPTSDFKLNDHYRSRYARLLMEQYPDLAGFFETRELRAA
jgi:hypothetical protein